MTKSSYPFDNAPVYEAQWSKMARLWRKDGVIPNEGNQLEVYGNSSGMQVKVKSGQAWIKGHFFESTAEEILAIDASDPTNPRIDRVILRLDWNDNSIDLLVLKGTPAASPSPPTLTQSSSRWEISLAKVQVDAGAVTIAANKVTDERYISTAGLPDADYDSGWFAVAYNNSYTKTHNLGVKPRIVVLQWNGYADGSGNTYLVYETVASDFSRAGAGIRWDNNNFYISTNTSSTSGTIITVDLGSGGGYYRILAWR